MKIARLFALPLLAALAACGEDAGGEGERRTAAGEVLGGTISDDMLPLDTVTSQSPPLREKAKGEPATERGDGAASAPSGEAPSDATEPVESEPAAEPSPAAPAPESDQ